MELIVHIHFDAKYRIESIESLFGGDLAGEEETGDGNYKRQDLMKMHAYRDAIKRSQGAYVIYPGRVSSAVHFSKSHEILPGIGAFSIAPDETGQAQGLETLESFMQEVLCYLTNRSTSLEQASYHTHQSYSDTWRSLTKVRARWSELDTLYFKKRSVPPAEHVVSIVCVPTVNELDWCRNNYSVPVRLSTANGSSRMHRDLASSLHLAVAASISTGAFELWKVLSPAFQIVTGDVLATMGYDTTEPDSIYALFEASVDVEWSTVRWSKKEVARAIRAHLRQREKLQQERLPSKDINHLYSTTLLELLNQLKATV
jgi:hypothetical protein